MSRCSSVGLDVPTIFFVDLQSRKIFMEYVHGKTVKALLLENESNTSKYNLSDQISEALCLMHDSNIVHGDLTTSNMMIRFSSDKLVCYKTLTFV